MLSFLASLVLSFLPPRYRQPWRHAESLELARAGALSGLLEAFLGLLLLIGGFISYAPQAWIGPMAWMEYILHPQAIFLAYLFAEGSIRFVVALAGGQTLGTLPLYLVAGTHSALERKRARDALGPLVADEVERGDGTEFELRVRSCRPKPNWDRLLTVSYEETLYEVAKQEAGAPPRPYVYLLRKMPEGKVVRGLHHYDPNEPFPQE